MTQESTLAQRHSQILQKIQAYAKPGVSADLIAVSKIQPVEKIRELYALGQRMFGENYAQELCEKAEALKDLDIQWVFIGQLQSNKIRRIVSVASEIHSVASFSHAQQIARHARDLGKAPYPLFLEVNAGGESSKGGESLAQIKPLAARMKAELPDLHIRGLMAIPPDIYRDEAFSGVPPLYRELKQLANEVGDGLLSLGMSNDLRMALEVGSNFVRIGTALFGTRP